MTKPQHEQDYRKLDGLVRAHGEPCNDEPCNCHWHSALTRLRDEAAKVPGLEAWREEMLHTLTLGLDYTPKSEEAPARLAGIITDAESAEQRAVTAESERDAARQEVDDWKDASGLERGGSPEHVGPAHLRADLRKRDEEMSVLRERVATLEASNKNLADGLANAADDAEACRGILQASLHNESVQAALDATEGWAFASETQQDAAHVRVAVARVRARADAAEARVNALEAQLRATEREKRAVDEHVAKLSARLENADEALAAADDQQRRTSQPPPAPAQGTSDAWIEAEGVALDAFERALARREPLSQALEYALATMRVSTPPALVEAVGQFIHEVDAALPVDGEVRQERFWSARDALRAAHASAVAAVKSKPPPTRGSIQDTGARVVRGLRNLVAMRLLSGRWVAEAQRLADDLDSALAAYDAAKGGHVETLDKARVAEVLRDRKNTPKDEGDDDFNRGWEAAFDIVARDLGLTLNVGGGK